MEEGLGFGEAAIVSPDRASAQNALRLASDLLSISRERFAEGDYPGAFEQSRNAIRMASAALLFKEGYLSDSLDATTAFLLKRYPGVFPVQEWLGLESMPAEGAPGLYNMILSAMGKIKKTGAQEAKEAILVAESFFMSAESELGL